MTTLKSSFNLANERMIVSRYNPSIKVHDLVDFEKEHESKKEFDFIDCWKSPHGKTVCKDVEFIDLNDEVRWKAKSNIVRENSNGDNVKMVESKTYHYDLIPEVYLRGYFTAYSSLDRVGRSMAFGLSNRGAVVKIDIIPSNIDINSNTLKELNILENRNVKNNCLEIYHGFIPERVDNPNSILYTSHGNISKESLSRFRGIWTNSTITKEKLKSITNIPIEYMPYGVDLKRYNPNVSKLSLGIPLNKFVFLSVTKWKSGKGIENMLRSFMETFSSEDDVSLLLVVKSERHEQISKDFEKIRHLVNKNDEDLPHIALYNKPIKEIYMPNLYALADIFVLPSENEKNGLTYLESGAVGKSVIACKCDLTRDFLNDENSFLIDCKDSISQLSSHMKTAYLNDSILNIKSNNLYKTVQSYDSEKIMDIMYNNVVKSIG